MNSAEVRPKCINPSCSNTYFRLVELEVRDATHKYVVPICTSCATPIPALDYFNLGSLLKLITKKLGIE